MPLNVHDKADLITVIDLIRRRQRATLGAVNADDRRLQAKGRVLTVEGQPVAFFADETVAKLAATAVNALPRLLKVIEDEVTATEPRHGLARDLMHSIRDDNETPAPREEGEADRGT